MIDNLVSGGVIVNYQCTSRCRHCLYNCGPHRSRDYMDFKTALACFEFLAARGVASVHIGGGEPLLRAGLLFKVLEAARQANVSIEYVETNSAWYRDESSACSLLSRLREKGVGTLLVSISPFHVEYVPFSKPLGVMAACRKTGMNIFPWMETFIRDLSGLEQNTPHGFETLVHRFGSSYLADIQSRYWIHPGGRALKTLRPLYETKTARRIVRDNPGSCIRQLSDTSHFHIDLYQQYIPGLCSGLGLDMKDIGGSLSKSRYPLIRLLMEKGVSGILELALENGFSPAPSGYISKCDLCMAARQFFFSLGRFENELGPKGFYA